MPEKKSKWTEREDRDVDPADFYKQVYNGKTRSQIAELDFPFWIAMTQNQLWHLAPKYQPKQDFGDDPVAYYHEHHNGTPRYALQREYGPLYTRLRDDGKLHIVPKYGDLKQ